MQGKSLLGVLFTWASHCFDVIALELVGAKSPTATHSNTSHEWFIRDFTRSGMRPSPSDRLIRSRGRPARYDANARFLARDPIAHATLPMRWLDATWTTRCRATRLCD